MKQQLSQRFRYIILAVFTAALISGCNQKKTEEPGFMQSFEEKKNDKTKAIAGMPYSGGISLQEAKEMREYYKKSNYHFKTKYLRGGAPVIDTLEGFSFDAADLEALIKDANGKKAKDIMFYFGRDANDVSHGGKKYPRYAIIAIGVDSTGNLADTAYDKADPCPPYCPNGN